MRTSVLFAAAWLATILPSVAHADVPPPAGYVESCTMANATADGQECIERQGGHTDQGVPGRWLADYGYCHRCQTYGASGWNEIYCRKKGDGKPLPEGWEAAIQKAVRDAPPGEGEKPRAAECAMPPLKASSKPATAATAKSEGSATPTEKPSGGCKCSSVGGGLETKGGLVGGGGALLVLGLRRRRLRAASVRPSARR
ncbi:MAG: hypothetical protein U0414_03350 [Polyangiaceae bacterium]